MAVEPFRLKTTPLDEETRLIAEKELRETPEVREKAIVELRRLLGENKDLYYADDDKTLLVFLRPTHFYPESAIKLVIKIFVKIIKNPKLRWVDLLILRFGGRVIKDHLAPD